MLSRYSRVASLAMLSIVSLAGLGAACNSSPFLATQFNTALANFLQGNIITPPPTNSNNNNNGNNAITSVCDLTDAQRSLRVDLATSSPQQVEFSITFIVSAGPGGFVCDEELQNYLNAGYTDAIPPGSGQTLPIGCDTITLLSGTRLLALEFGSNQGNAAILAANASGDDAQTGNTLQLRRRDNGLLDIPLPELIVFGSDDVNYICSGGTQGDLCTQRGFRYLGAGNVTVGKSPEASRIQGTVCAENAGSAPEWRLDKTLDNVTQPFQYGRGGSIIVRVLNRANDALDNSRNQVVWTVLDADGNTIHVENP